MDTICKCLLHIVMVQSETFSGTITYVDMRQYNKLGDKKMPKISFKSALEKSRVTMPSERGNDGLEATSIRDAIVAFFDSPPN